MPETISPYTDDAVPENLGAGGNVYSIAPSLPFLRELARMIVDGTLFADFKPIENPISLSDATIYLPTRRAARGLTTELVSLLKSYGKSSAILLPKIRTIGDLDDEELILGLTNDMPVDIGRSVNLQERQLILARLTKHWSNSLNQEQRALFEAEEIVLPSSSADAIRLASNLANFMDQIEAQEVPWRSLEEVEGDELQQWWQITLSFLKIIMEQWPKYLASIDEINPAEFRNRHTQYRIAQLAQASKAGPVIIAGSTGSFPATTRLIKAIAGLENGAVVLPGVDANLPKDMFESFSHQKDTNNEDIYSTHPQFGLARLITNLGLKPDTINHVSANKKSLSDRERFLNHALLPPEKSAFWSKIRGEAADKDIKEAFEKVSIINAAGERQEALAIALLFRETLEDPLKTAALITPDRNLARRVATEMERYGVLVDDSGGAPLNVSPPALFIKQLLKVIFEAEDPVTISTLIKSDFLLVGFEQKKARHLAELLELLLIRDAIQLPKLNSIGQATQTALDGLATRKYAPQALKALIDDDEIGGELLKFALKIENACTDIYNLLEKEFLKLDETFGALLKTATDLNKDVEGQCNLFSSAAGEMVAELISSYDEIKCDNFKLQSFDVVPVFEALLSEKRVRSAERTHPRLHIYGPLEARLQTSDLTILGGLNEGVWPQIGSNDPFLNRPMRAQLGLPLPERRIGLSAHDFQQLMGNEEIVLTRSNRVDNAPSVASRWLQRLTTFIGKQQSAYLTGRGEYYLDLVEQLDQYEEDPIGTSRPEPKPPVSSRPNSLSITEIETWIRDPYAIYAKHVLGLYPIAPLVRDNDAALKGTLYHDILADFVENWHGVITTQAGQALSDIADQRFAELSLAPEVKTVWRTRFDTIADDFLNYEKQNSERIFSSAVEIDVHDGERKRAEIEDTGFFIRGRADRIDLLNDGTLRILDYKTGTNPSMKEARLLAPQLSLEAALAKRGKFENVKAAQVSEISYVRLRVNDFKTDHVSDNKKHPIENVIEDAWERLIDQIKAYKSAEQGYISRFAAKSYLNRAGDYDHLARVREWSANEDEVERYDE